MRRVQCVDTCARDSAQKGIKIRSGGRHSCQKPVGGESKESQHRAADECTTSVDHSWGIAKEL